MERAAEHLQQAETALAAFYLGQALVARQEYDEALKAFDKAEKSATPRSKVQLQRAGIYLQQGELDQGPRHPRRAKKEGLESHSAEYHFQIAGLHQAEGDSRPAIKHLERAVELDPTHTGALFQLGYVNDLAGNDDEAIGYYERCLKHPPVHVGALNNLGILYEDNEQVRQGRRVLRNACSRPTRPTSGPGCSSRTPQAVADDVLQPGRRAVAAAASARCSKSRSPTSSCRCAAATA